MAMAFELEDYEDGDLPEVRVEEIRSEGGVLGVLNRQRNQLMETKARIERGEASLVELRERQERMAADAEAVLRAARASEPLRRVEPAGSGRDAEEAYREYDPSNGTPTGGIVLKGLSAERVKAMTPSEAAEAGALVRRLPNGRIVVEARSGYFTDPRPKTLEQVRLQGAYAAFATTLRIAQAVARTRRQEVRSTYDMIVEHPTVRSAFFALDQAIRSAVEPAGIAVRKMFERVMSGSTGSGGDWIATPYLQGGWIGPYDLTPALADRMMQKDAPGPSFTAPTLPSGEMIAKMRGRVQSETPSAYPASTQTTGKRTISLVTLVLRQLLDDEWLADFERVGLVDMEVLMDRLRRGLVRSIEAAIVNGDTTATHEDAIASWNMGGLVTAGAYDGSDSPLRAWKGLRRLCFDDSCANDAAGTFSGTVAMASLARLGTRMSSPGIAWVANVQLLLKKLMVADDFRLWSSVGDQATARTGVMGRMLGHDVLLSEFLTSDMNASGKFDNVTTTKTALLAVDFDAFELWSYAEDTFLDVAQQEAGAVHLIASARRKLERATVSDNGHAVSMDYDL